METGAGWYIARANPEKGMELLLRVIRHALPAGLLAEQLHPDNGMPLPVSPQTWSHSVFVGTVIRYLNLIHDVGPARCAGSRSTEYPMTSQHEKTAPVIYTINEDVD
jgi:hypothetical protein